MSLFVAFLLTAVTVAFVAWPLLSGSGSDEPLRLAVAQQMIQAQGVTYGSEEEWSLDRALGKVAEGEPEVSLLGQRTELEEEIERKVASLRRQRKDERRQGKQILCPECQRPFTTGESYCARCGAAHPRVCPQCGQRYREGDAFCTACGGPLAGGGK